MLSAILNGKQGDRHSLDIELLDVAIDRFVHNIFLMSVRSLKPQAAMVILFF